MLYKHFPNFLKLDVALSIPVASFFENRSLEEGITLMCQETVPSTHKGILRDAIPIFLS